LIETRHGFPFLHDNPASYELFRLDPESARHLLYEPRDFLLILRAVLAQGKIVALEQVSEGRGGGAMSPIVKYTGEQESSGPSVLSGAFDQSMSESAHPGPIM
jgi:hypothetical protein